jgi:D-inositol-3-phosphate glycosyltransferase
VSDLRRVAVVSYHSSPLAAPGFGDSGGMTIYVRALAAALARRGVETDIFTRAAEPGTAGVSRIAAGVRVIAVDAGPQTPLPKERLPRYLDEFATGIRAFAISRKLTYQIVHSHYWQSGLAALRLARAWDVPLVHSHHTLGKVKNSLLTQDDPPEPAERLAGEAEVISGADVLIASTDEERRHLARLYEAPEVLLKTIHPGVDHRLFRPRNRSEARARLGLGDEAVMLYVGRIQPLKGLELAVRSAAQLAPVLDGKLSFLVVGGASGASGEAEIARLRRVADEVGLEETVRFLGPQPHRRLPDYYSAADVLVVCSHYESFGLAALEAHSCGLPVVATTAGGLTHIVRDSESGFLLETRDSSEFAARLKMLLKDPELQAAFSETSYQTARRLSWDDTAEKVFELYECLVDAALPEACVCGK